MHSWFENESVSCTVCLTLWSHGLYVAHQAPLYMKFSWFSVLRFKPFGSYDIDIDCVRVLKSHAFFPFTFCGDILTSKYMPFKILIFQHRALWLGGKESTCYAETQVWSLGWEDPLEKEMATHFSVLAWKIPWTEEPGELQSMWLQRVRHDLAT